MNINSIYLIVTIAIMSAGQALAQEQTQLQEQVREQEAATAEPIYVIDGKRADVFDVRAVDMSAFKEIAKPKKSDFEKAGITADEAAGREVKFLKSKNPLTLAKAGDMVEYTGQIQTEYGFGASEAKVYTEYGQTQAGGTAFLRVKPDSRIVVGKEGYAPVSIELGKTLQRTITLYKPSEKAVEQDKEDDNPTAEQKKVKATSSLAICDSAGNPIEGATIYMNHSKKTKYGHREKRWRILGICGVRNEGDSDAGHKICRTRGVHARLGRRGVGEGATQKSCGRQSSDAHTGYDADIPQSAIGRISRIYSLAD